MNQPKPDNSSAPPPNGAPVLEYARRPGDSHWPGVLLVTIWLSTILATLCCTLIIKSWISQNQDDAAFAGPIGLISLAGAVCTVLFFVLSKGWMFDRFGLAAIIAILNVLAFLACFLGAEILWFLVVRPIGI